MEHRLHELELREAIQRETLARLDERSKYMQETLDQLVSELAPLRKAVHEGRGAVYMLMFISGGIGAAAMAVLNWFLGKH